MNPVTVEKKIKSDKTWFYFYLHPHGASNPPQCIGVRWDVRKAADYMRGALGIHWMDMSNTEDLVDIIAMMTDGDSVTMRAKVKNVDLDICPYDDRRYPNNPNSAYYQGSAALRV